MRNINDKIRRERETERETERDRERERKRVYIKILYTTTHTIVKKCLPQYFFHYSTAETTDPMLTLPSIINERKRNKIKRAM